MCKNEKNEEKHLYKAELWTSEEGKPNILLVPADVGYTVDEALAALQRTVQKIMLETGKAS